jgi:hypothetical protein
MTSTRIAFPAVAAVLGLLAIANASGQTTYAPADEDVVRYDPSRIQTFRGLVVGTITAPFEGEQDGMVAVIESGSLDIQAHLGPRTHLDRIGCDVDAGDSVVIEGTPVVEDDVVVVGVFRMTVDGTTCHLRNSNGTSPADNS